MKKTAFLRSIQACFSIVLLLVLLSSSFTPVYAISIPAEINKQFTPIFIDAGGVSRLRVSIFNPNTFPLTNASWTDNLISQQPGLSIANPANITTNNCGVGSNVSGIPGSTTLSLTNAIVPAQVGATPGECYVEVNVTSTTPDNLVNTIPANHLQATGNDGGTVVNITNTRPASATLTVTEVLPPSLSKGFAPNTISMGNVSTLSITINNNDVDTNLTGTSFTDTLPANVVLANPVSPTLTNCGGAASIAATVGGNTIALTNATVTPNQNCVVTVNVTSAVQGVYVNTIPAGPAGPGSIRTDQGVTNAAPARATLNVQPINVTKQFNATSFQAGGTSTLTITLQNPTASTYTGVSLSDTLPTTPNTNLVYVPGSSTTTCLPNGTTSNTSTTVSLVGGTIPPNSTCTITVNVTTPGGAPPATYTNIIPPRAVSITSHPTATNETQATADVSVYAVGTGMAGSAKSFSDDLFNPGESTRLRIDLFAPADTNLTDFSMIDNLPPGVTVSNSTPAAISGCGIAPPRVLTATTGSTSISLTGGTILAGSLCRIDVWVTSNTPGTVTNTITPANISNNENRDPVGNLTDTLTVYSRENLSISKAFYPPTVSPNGLSVLTITLQNTYPSPLVNTSMTDPLPGSVTDGIVVAPIPDASTTCAGGSITAVPGSQTITMTGGTVPAQVGAVPGICTITVTVQGKDGDATPNNRVNTIPAMNVSGTVQSTGVTINSRNQAQDVLRTERLSIGIVKGFSPTLVYGGASSTMSVQLINPNNAVLTGIAFTDNMSLLLPGIIIANPANFNVGTCSGVLTGNPGDTSFSFSGGTLPANTNCVLTLSVVMNINGNRDNLIPAGAVTTFNGATNPTRTIASLTNLPGANVSKAFTQDPIPVGGTSTLIITIDNTSTIPLTGMGLADTLPGALPAGLEIANPAGSSTTCGAGAQVTATPGLQDIVMTGGSLAANSSCTISVNVTSTVPGSYVNTIPPNSLSNNESASNSAPATATLRVNVNGNPSGLTKIVSATNQAFTTSTGVPPSVIENVAIGEIVTYQVSVVIPPGTYTNATLVDTMERGLAFVACDAIPPQPGLTTSVAGGFNAICATPTVDNAGGVPLPASSADIDRRVTYNFGTLTNAGPADATVTVTYRAMVLDIPANVDGVSLNNSATWTSSAGNIPPVQTTVSIIEPDMTIAKSANVNFIANGSTATFTLIVNHTAVSNTDAFDVVVTDVLPTTVDFVAGSLDCDDGQQDPNVSCTYDPLTRTIRAEWSAFTLLPAGDQGIIRFDVLGNATIPVGGSVTNVANVEWTSIPGPQTTPQSFSNPPNPFATERFYDPADPAPLYNVSSSLVLTPLGAGGGGGGAGAGGNGNNNNADPATVAVGGFLIPVTGFAPDTITKLDIASRPAYNSTNLTIEIPVLKVKTSIVGVQLKKGNWDVSSLQNQAGWLNGTAYPTWEGNSVLTGHAVNINGKAGVFSSLKYLNAGEYIFVYDAGYRYTYKVVSNKHVQPNDITVLQHEEKAYITLITCDIYDEKAGTYLSRVAVRAVLVDIQEIK
ncbi:MAG: sortase [Anaerolineales bacterium]|nr:sortase [Anaerolineales bacterium]